jgi:hypothetical protein
MNYNAIKQIRLSDSAHTAQQRDTRRTLVREKQLNTEMTTLTFYPHTAVVKE